MNYYEEAITMLYGENINFREIVFEIAKRNPKAFVSAAKRLEINEIPWQKQCKQLVSEGSLVEAIRLCRMNADMGLKEAKDFVQSL